MARTAFAAVFTALSLLLNGCGRGDDQRWGGFVLGQPAPAGAYDPAASATASDHVPPPHAFYMEHAVTIPDVPEFPWQEAFAQVDRRGRVITVTLSIACCAMPPLYDVPLSPDAIRDLVARERKVPDRFEDNVGPPRYRYVNVNDSTRSISVGDMTAYGQAALKQAVARLGAPTKQATERLIGTVALSYLEDFKVLRVHWAHKGPNGPQDFAVLDIGKSQTCLTVVAPGDRQLPIQSGCGGLDLSSYDQFYPAAAPGAQPRAEALPVNAENYRKL